MNPKVSLCIPTYNGEAFLSECLESVVNQTFRDMEILVVDDDSRDDSVAIAQRYVRMDRRVRVIANKKHLGLVENWNRCVDLANGEWIKFVFQDDRIEPFCISRMVNASRAGVDLVVVRRLLDFEQGTPDSVQELYANHLAEHNLTRHFSDCSYIPPEAFAKLGLEAPYGNCLGEPTATMIRRSAFIKYGHFNSNLVSLCDWEYFARVAVNTGLCYISEPLAYFRIHSRARSAEIREQRSFWVATLDPLIIQYELVYFKAFSLVRSLAERENPAVRLKYRLADAVRHARREAFTLNDRGRAKAELRRVVMIYPRMLLFPLGYIIRAGLQKAKLYPKSSRSPAEGHLPK
jgi:glycosyltransferase involved in cell wall biosynthesis